MSLLGLMNQTISISSRSGRSGDGRETLSPAVSVRARVQPTAKRVLMPDKNVMTLDAIVYVPADTNVNQDDRVDYASKTYKVFSKYEAVDGTGRVNHIKLELIRWVYR